MFLFFETRHVRRSTYLVFYGCKEYDEHTLLPRLNRNIYRSGAAFSSNSGGQASLDNLRTEARHST